jgi:hypothetical protein
MCGIWRELVAGAGRPDGWVRDIHGDPERYGSVTDAATGAGRLERLPSAGHAAPIHRKGGTRWLKRP